VEVRVLFRAHKMKNKETIAIINDPDVTLGSLKNNNIKSVNAWDLDWNEMSSAYDYIILGGHMGAYETEKYQYILSEKEWLSRSVDSGVKILGICLGSQLVADALDGKAYLSDKIEFGFKKLNFIRNDELFSDFKSTEIFTWHRDTFKIPLKAKLIAATEFPQIFKINNTVCIQFHPEVTVELFDKWYDNEISKSELKNHDVENTRIKLIKYENLMSQKVNTLFKKWKES